MKSEESDDYINFTDFITLNLIGSVHVCVCVCVPVCKFVCVYVCMYVRNA